MNSKLDKNGLVKGLGFISLGILAVRNIKLDKEVRRLSRSYRSFTKLITDVEEERQKDEFFQEIRLENLEDMLADLYLEFDCEKDSFEVIEREEK